jgi:two-component system, LytTR family, response regulator LytT
MTSIIVEDEQVAAQRLLRMVKELYPSIENIAIFESVEEAAGYLLNESHPDILFLDIQVADGSSFELLKIIDVKSKIIFTTAYSEHAAKAFRENAVDYLLKPLKIEELGEAIEKVKNQVAIKTDLINVQPEYKDRILIKFGSRLTVLKTSDIAYIYSENKIVYFYQKSGIKTASDYKLQDLESMFDPNYFFRINRQFIVHIDSIENMSTYSKARLNINLIPGFKDEIIVSTEKTPELKDWLRNRKV